MSAPDLSRSLGCRRIGIESELIIHFVDRGLKIEDVPIDVRYEVPNGHKEGPVSMGVKLSNQIVPQNIYRRPLKLMGVLGIAIATFGFMLGIASMLHFYILGWTWLFHGMFASYCVVIGSMLGLIAALLHSMIRLNRNKNPKVRRGGQRHGDGPCTRKICPLSISQT